MKAFVKYAVVLASGLAIGFYLHEPPKLERFVTLPSLEEIDVVVREALAAARPKALVDPVDPAAAALVEEELDYRTAQRTRSLDGWRAFVAAHPSGLHAQDAKAKIDLLIAADTPPANAADRTNAAPAQEAPESGRAAQEAKGAAPVEAKSESGPANQRSAGTQVASLDSRDACPRGVERLLEINKSPADEGANGSVEKLRCNVLQPEALRLMDHSGPLTTPTTVATTLNAAAEQSAGPENEGAADPSAKAEAAEAAAAPAASPGARMDSPSGSDSNPASASPSPPAKSSSAGVPKRRAAPRPDKARVTASSHRHEPVRHASRCSRSGCHWRHPELPPILMALLGEKPRGFGAFGRTGAADRPSAAPGR